MCACVRVCVRACTSIRVCACVLVCACVCPCVCFRACVHVCAAHAYVLMREPFLRTDDSEGHRPVFLRKETLKVRELQRKLARDCQVKVRPILLLDNVMHLGAAPESDHMRVGH